MSLVGRRNSSFYRGVLALGVLLLLPPSAVAVHPEDLRLIETHMIQDEVDPVFERLGGYDIGDVFIGEAYEPDAGTYVYVHVTLHGNFSQRPPGTGAYMIRVSLTSALGERHRDLHTDDGVTFWSDPQPLEYRVLPDGIDLTRVGFWVLGTDFVSGLRVESYVGTDLRDRAPGGVFVPGSNGVVEIPREWIVLSDTYRLEGPRRYFQVESETLGPYRVDLDVSNPFAHSTQTVTVRLPASEEGGLGYASDSDARLDSSVPSEPAPTSQTNSFVAYSPYWTAQVLGEPIQVIPPGAHAPVSLRLIPHPDDEGIIHPLRFDIVSDAGGRVPLYATVVEGAVVVSGQEPTESAVKVFAWTPASTPFPSLLWVTTAAATVGLLLRRRFNGSV